MRFQSSCNNYINRRARIKMSDFSQWNRRTVQFELMSNGSWFMDNIDCQCLEVRVCRNENVFSMNRNVMLIWKRGKKHRILNHAKEKDDWKRGEGRKDRLLGIYNSFSQSGYYCIQKYSVFFFVFLFKKPKIRMSF